MPASAVASAGRIAGASIPAHQEAAVPGPAQAPARAPPGMLLRWAAASGDCCYCSAAGAGVPGGSQAERSCEPARGVVTLVGGEPARLTAPVGTRRLLFFCPNHAAWTTFKTLARSGRASESPLGWRSGSCAQRLGPQCWSPHCSIQRPSHASTQLGKCRFV
jgi:hypothetical protein